MSVFLRGGEHCSQYNAVHFESMQGNLNWFDIGDGDAAVEGFRVA